jgi:hypothetical protein
VSVNVITTAAGVRPFVHLRPGTLTAVETAGSRPFNRSALTVSHLRFSLFSLWTMDVENGRFPLLAYNVKGKFKLQFSL